MHINLNKHVGCRSVSGLIVTASATSYSRDLILGFLCGGIITHQVQYVHNPLPPETYGGVSSLRPNFQVGQMLDDDPHVVDGNAQAGVALSSDPRNEPCLPNPDLRRERNPEIFKHYKKQLRLFPTIAPRPLLSTSRETENPYCPARCITISGP